MYIFSIYDALKGIYIKKCIPPIIEGFIDNYSNFNNSMEYIVLFKMRGLPKVHVRHCTSCMKKLTKTILNMFRSTTFGD